MSLEKIINDAWKNKDQVNQNSDPILKDSINQIISDLDCGKVRVAEKIKGEWLTHQGLLDVYDHHLAVSYASAQRPDPLAATTEHLVVAWET